LVSPLAKLPLLALHDHLHKIIYTLFLRSGLDYFAASLDSLRSKLDSFATSLDSLGIPVDALEIH
jgi:hypothetical protein